MPRSKAQHVAGDWYLVEWMRTLRVTQAKLAKETGWGKARTNDIYHGRTAYYRDFITEVARALNLEPFELLMTPDRAMAIRRFRESALVIAADSSPELAATG